MFHTDTLLPTHLLRDLLLTLCVFGFKVLEIFTSQYNLNSWGISFWRGRCMQRDSEYNEALDLRWKFHHNRTLSGQRIQPGIRPLIDNGNYILLTLWNLAKREICVWCSYSHIFSVFSLAMFRAGYRLLAHFGGENLESKASLTKWTIIKRANFLLLRLSVV